MDALEQLNADSLALAKDLQACQRELAEWSLLLATAEEGSCFDADERMASVQCAAAIVASLGKHVAVLKSRADGMTERLKTVGASSGEGWVWLCAS
jgi:hypothetical protein